MRTLVNPWLVKLWARTNAGAPRITAVPRAKVRRDKRDADMETSAGQILVGQHGVECDRSLQMAGLNQDLLIGVRSGGGHPPVRNDGLPHIGERAEIDRFVE